MRSGKITKIFISLFIFSVLSVFMSLSAGALEYRDDLKLKVGLEFGSSSPSQAEFSSEQGFRIITFNEDTYESLPLFETAQPEITVKNVDGIAVIYLPDGSEIYRSENETLYLTGVSGFVVYKDKTYIEVIKIFCKDGLMRVINIIAFEEYIKGVLPKEIYPSWPEEALKTAAVVSRTFGLYSLGGKHTKYGVDVCTTSCCQNFGGNGDNEYPSTNAAVEATKNQILAYNGEVAMAVYTSSVGVHTESASGAWGGSQSKYPYLSGVATPHETPEEYPRGIWSNEVSASELLSYIDSKSAYTGKLKDGIASIDLEYGETGYARKITVTDIHGNSVSAKNSDGVRGMLSQYVRSAMVTVTPNYEAAQSNVAVLTANGIVSTSSVGQNSYVLRANSEQPSKLFEVSPYPTSFTMSGMGWGHGVGLSQFGAMTLAQNGKTYTEILSFYYPGTYITTPSALAAENTPTEEQPETVPEQPQGEQGVIPAFEEAVQS